MCACVGGGVVRVPTSAPVCSFAIYYEIYDSSSVAYIGKTAPWANAKIAPLISEKVFDPNSIPVGTFKHAVHITCRRGYPPPTQGSFCILGIQTKRSGAYM